MTDRVWLRGVRAVGRHGVFAQERETGQEFVVDVSMEVDTAAAAAGDALELTVDYGAVAVKIAELIEGEPVALLETLAARIADACLADPRVDGVEVTVHKPSAPVSVPVDDVAVTIRRSRRRD